MSVTGGVVSPMTPHAFIKKWKKADLTERQSVHEHFVDLCALFDHPTPAADDPTGDHFAFEKGATKVGGGRGFADVWKKDYFAWEYKRKNGDLDKALLQLIRYAPALESPPLQVVCDTEHFRIHTAWTNTVPKTYDLKLDELANPEQREILRNVFYDPEKLKPTKTRASLTAEAADKFSTIALRLHGRGTPQEVAHFINQLVFCFFANSVKLLPDGLFSKLLKRASQKPDKALTYFNQLFAAMEEGGEFDLTDIAWFNGGLFDGQRSLRLDEGDIGLLVAAGSLDWSQIDPTIFGTLFERFLDPDKRAQIGAHYTDRDKIMKIVDPIILRPLREEWGTAKIEIEAHLSGKTRPSMLTKKRRRMTRIEAAEETRSKYLERLRKVTILDPACGSGNFLYLALQGVKDIENKANLDCEMLGLQPRVPVVGPEIVHGIEINPLAAELARTTIWIGDIQWHLRNGIYARPQPILRKLDSIECRDALITKHNRSVIEAQWPKAEFIVGNPPFLGGKLMRKGLGNKIVNELFSVYNGRVPPEADLVLYWFEKSRKELAAKRTKRIGLVSTNSIRGGANRKIIERIAKENHILEAWSDEAWVVEGASVRVSLICFDNGSDPARLNGRSVTGINADLTAGSLDLTKARRLIENREVAFMGDTKGGAFDVPGELARSWLQLPMNPNGHSNAKVLKPWRNGMDVARRSADKWIVDFGCEMSEREASLFEAPFDYIKECVWPERSKNRRESYKRFWWRHVEPRPAMFAKIANIHRFLVTPTVAKYRTFSWMSAGISPDHQLIIIARDDDTTFGILHSRFHEAWSLRLGTSLEDRPRYTPTTTFETFPFPDGLTPDVPAKRYSKTPHAKAIAQAANRLDELRNNWLNPSDLIEAVPEVVPGYPIRIMPRSVQAVAVLRTRTLTNLYNQKPNWLIAAHRDLDSAVARAYGWDPNISDEDALARLLELNLLRSDTSDKGNELPFAETDRISPSLVPR